MKRSLKSLVGVTLLEIMLVLAIAAMIIIMSIRYYQSASGSEQANALLSQIQAITAAADNLSMGSGQGYLGVTTATLTPLMPGGSAGMNTPWGSAITVNGTAASYTVSIPGIPANVCPLVQTKLAANPNYGSPTTCNPTAVTTMAYTYSP